MLKKCIDYLPLSVNVFLHPEIFNLVTDKGIDLHNKAADSESNEHQAILSAFKLEKKNETLN